MDRQVIQSSVRSSIIFDAVGLLGGWASYLLDRDDAAQFGKAILTARHDYRTRSPARAPRLLVMTVTPELSY